MGLSSGFFTFMHFVFWFTLFCLTFLYHFSYCMQPLCHDDERYALLQFRDSLTINKAVSRFSSAYPKVASWNQNEESSDCCSWNGVTCNQSTGHVIKLDLTSSYLYGSINSSSSLFKLVHLEWLSLADNDFDNSEIPSGIMNLSRLSHLDLSYSVFSGQIPSEILQLSKLVSLDLSGANSLKLQKPGLRSLAQKLTNLKMLDLSEVNISSSIPHVLANLSSLTTLYLRNCSLKGEFPTKIFQLTNLYYLSVSANPELSGYFPEFDKNSLLEELRLRGTRFSGKIPDSIENLKSLSILDISECNFSGTIPPSLGNLTQLSYLDLSENEFPGELPSVIGNLGSLKVLDIYNCNFWGEVPSSLGNLAQLEYLKLSSNNFSANSGSMSWMTNLTKLTHLELSGINLAGKFPSCLKNLTQLTVLNMLSNQLTGPIPEWLVNLKQLSILNLGLNQLTGHIPSQISNLSELNSLQLRVNQLQGLIPMSLFELKNLEILDLYSNNLSGTMELEMFLHRLKNLDVLILSANKLSLLTKTINNTDFKKFRIVGLASCNLSEFPNFLKNQDQLQGLDLSSNKIGGQTPGWLFNIGTERLGFLNLSYNFLTGFGDDLIALPWISLVTLDLRFNKLQGQLPVPPISIFSYLVSNNNLTGEVPPLLCNSKRLYALDLSNNNLRGKLPQCLGNFSVDLSILNLQNNKFHGSIPQNFVNGTNLRMIALSHNSFQGKIPRSLTSCTKLEFLDVGSNQITDIFPSWLGNLPEFKVLILRSNKFHGVIKEPKTEYEFPKLQIIDLSHNRFTGNLPSKYFQCWNAMKVVNASHQLTYMQQNLLPRLPIFTGYGYFYYSLTMSNKGLVLDYGKVSNILTGIILSSNEFVGEIPESIANLKGLRFLDLSSNNLQGHIPSTLGNLTELESLDMSNNNLSGEIPQQVAELTFLAFFNVSNNYLTGRIPQGKQFATFENNSFDGNSGLCGIPLSRKCENSEPSHNEDQDLGSSSFEFDWKLFLIGYPCGLIIGIILGHIFSVVKHEWLTKISGRLWKRVKDEWKRLLSSYIQRVELENAAT